MNEINNSTGLPGGATIACMVKASEVDAVCDMIDMKAGVIAKAQAAMRLSSILVDKIDDLIGYGKGKTGPFPKTRVFTIYNHATDEIEWLEGELCEVTRDLADMVDRLQNCVVPLADASYHAKQAVAQ